MEEKEDKEEEEEVNEEEVQGNKRRGDGVCRLLCPPEPPDMCRA